MNSERTGAFLGRTTPKGKYLRKFLTNIFLGPCKPLNVTHSGQASSDLLRNRINNDEPFLACRFGNTELAATLRYLYTRKLLPLYQFTNKRWWWDENLRFDMRNCAGFFPTTDSNLLKFGEKMLDVAGDIDILGSWLPRESRLLRYNHRVQPLIIPKNDLEPYYHARPWSEALEGKRVLVIHPFASTIEEQYARREYLFSNEKILPSFQLITFKAVQSIAGNDPGFESWFDALDWMCQEVESIKFEVAIIGAGAYGLPLGAFIKKTGGKAIHLGGATQILFGIKGKRWDDQPFYRNLYNEFWVRPSINEVPGNFQLVEGGCYW
ncbi:MAG: hypothetical protein IGQ88_00595 [Gloeomargaritaceae cyanobacterium C42_A2020_066]|nr:hypothetical protein [Gloeomargaritaceae cyanobacterium C42_A2020_066]